MRLIRHRLFERRVGLILMYYFQQKGLRQAIHIGVHFTARVYSGFVICHDHSHREGGLLGRGSPLLGTLATDCTSPASLDTTTYPSSMRSDSSLSEDVYNVVCVKSVVLLFWLCIVCDFSL